MQDTKTEKIIREQIKAALQKVTQINAPKVYEMLQTTDGYQNLEATIIEKMISEFCSADATIIMIENEL